MFSKIEKNAQMALTEMITLIYYVKDNKSTPNLGGREVLQQ